MAPDATPTHDTLERTLKNLTAHLLSLIVQISSHSGPSTTPSLHAEITTIITHITSLLRLSATQPFASSVVIPPDIIAYVQDGRNPDIYTREFVELAMRNNQLLRGKALAFARFRDVLAGEIAGAVPALRGDVGKVVERSGGRLEEGKEGS